MQRTQESSFLAAVKVFAHCLDDLISGASLWEAGADQFEVKFKPLGLQWLDQGKTRARFFGRGLQVFDGEIKILEATSDFKDGKLAANRVEPG